MAATTTTDGSQASVSEAAAQPTKQRDALLDNAKFVLITLVVIGHTIGPTAETRLGDALYFWIYLFHMPAFVFICGYLSKSFDGSRRRVDKLLTTVAAPYLIFWGLYALQSLSVGRALPDSPLEPLWITWFLAALFVWRLTVPLWNRVRWPLAVAFLVSLASGAVATGDVLGFSRILGLLPFFVAGLLVRPDHLAYLGRTWVRVCSLGVVLGTMAATYLYLERLSREWVYWRDTLNERGIELLPVGLPGRLAFLLLAAALTLALLSLTPRRATFFTGLGALTMYVFLLHGLPIRIATEFGWYELFTGDTGLAVNLGVALALTFLLCTPWVRWATRWAVEPRVGWMLRRPATEPEPARPPAN